MTYRHNPNPNDGIKRRRIVIALQLTISFSAEDCRSIDVLGSAWFCMSGLPRDIRLLLWGMVQILLVAF